MMSYFTNIEFAWPYAFAALLVLPLLRKFSPTSSQDADKDERSGLNVPAYNQAHSHYGLSFSSNQSAHKRKKFFLALLWSLLVFALMRPQYIGPAIELPLEGRDLMLAIDISPSMKEQDMPLNGSRATRIDVVKHVVGEFTTKREGDRIGLVLFGTQPYVQSPLSFDTTTVNTLLQEAFLGMAGNSTAIGDAIALAVKRLKERPKQSRVLILLTDGANTAGEIPPEKAAQLASSFGVKVYTVGIGADEMMQRSLFGSRRVNPSADLDEAMLQTIADTSGGLYFRARNIEDLQRIYAEIDQLEPIESDARVYRPSKAISHYFIIAALALFFGYKSVVFIQRRIANTRSVA